MIVLKDDYLYIASDYYHDAKDFLHRYRLTVDDFYAIKSKRFKLFVDLRMAAECALKANIVYHLCSKLSREDAINKAESYKHSMQKMWKDVGPLLDQPLFGSLDRYFPNLEKLPVGLRYRLDGMDYREFNEELYYSTIGDDYWLDGLCRNLMQLTNDIGKKLSSHSRIIPSGELFNEILKPRFNKYRDQASNSKKPASST